MCSSFCCSVVNENDPLDKRASPYLDRFGHRHQHRSVRFPLGLLVNYS